MQTKIKKGVPRGMKVMVGFIQWPKMIELQCAVVAKM
jgi:hypothetical protein